MVILTCRSRVLHTRPQLPDRGSPGHDRKNRLACENANNYIFLVDISYLWGMCRQDMKKH